MLVTTFTCDGGVFELTDCMPLERTDDDPPDRHDPTDAIMRRARCVEGSVDVVVRIDPRFEYGCV